MAKYSDLTGHSGTLVQSRVKIGETRFGKGVFTMEHVKKGEHVMTFRGRRISFEESVAMGTDECYSLQVGEKEYVHLDSPSRFVNHSCDPNCGLDGNLFLISLTDIPAGSELNFDYSTTMLERRWEMDCRCGSSACRGRILDFDYLPVALQKRYLSQGFVQPFIAAKQLKRYKL